MAAALVIGAGTSHSLGVKSLLATFYPACPKTRARASLKQLHKVRCDAEANDAVGFTETEEDQGGKKTVTALDDLLKNPQGSDDSKKKLGFGTKPTSEPVDVSPEVDTTSAVEDIDFGALFALDGPLSEILSGRLAMLGMASALLAEKATGLTVFEQAFTHGKMGLVLFASAVQLLTYASLTPITKGESVDSRSLGPFTTKAERWNGRLAMVGFLLLVVTEAVRHAPLFQ